MADLPPRDQWIADGDGITRWRPVVERIDVQPAAMGKLLRLCLEGQETHVLLTREQARHLAELLLA